MDFDAVCRTCLGKKSLKPIFKNKEHHDRFSAAMNNTTGLKVELNDGLPQNICIDCMIQINASLKFRAQCKDSEFKLLYIAQLNNSSENLKEQENTDLDLKTDFFNEKPYIDFNQTDLKALATLKTEKNQTKFEKVIIIENKVIDLQTNVLNTTNNTSLITETKSIKTLLTEDLKIEDKKVKKQNKRVKCRICKMSLSIRSVDSHMNKRHPGADERKVKCDLCDTYVLKIKMNRHLKMMHGQDYLICSYCKSKFFTKEELIEHVPICGDKKRKRNPQDSGKEMSECEICHKKMQRASLKMHQKIKHAGLGPVCDHCGRKFGNKFRLNEHLRSKHGYDKYKCEQCPFQSASAATLRNHERRHRGEKPYVCEVCGARFHAAYLLPQHRQSHRTDKPLKCPLCPARFKANNSLHMHKAACHSRARYTCSLCARAYSCRHYAVKHLKAVHGCSGAVAELLQPESPSAGKCSEQV